MLWYQEQLLSLSMTRLFKRQGRAFQACCSKRTAPQSVTPLCPAKDSRWDEARQREKEKRREKARQARIQSTAGPSSPSPCSPGSTHALLIRKRLSAGDVTYIGGKGGDLFRMVIYRQFTLLSPEWVWDDIYLYHSTIPSFRSWEGVLQIWELKMKVERLTNPIVQGLYNCTMYSTQIYLSSTSDFLWLF